MSESQVLSRRIAIAAGIAGALGVLIGAFGAHGLEDFLAKKGLDVALIAKRAGQFDVGARYHLIHAVALLALGAFGDSGTKVISPRSLRTVAWLIVIGMVLFSGSLYLLVATNTPWLGAITPLGGVAWVIAWFWIAVAAFRRC